MKAIYHILILLAVIAAPYRLSAGGPWAEGQGRGYVEASALFTLLTDNLDHTYQLYAELGILEKLTLKTILPFRYVGSPESLDLTQFEKGKLFGVGNLTVGLRYEFFKEKAVLSAGFDVEMRTLASDDALGLRTGYERFTFRPAFTVGWGTSSVYAYGEIRPGFSTNGFGHDLGFIAEIGGLVDEDVWLAGYFEVRGVFGNGTFNDTDPLAYSATGFFQDGQSYISAGVKFSAYLIKGFGLNAGVFYGTGVNQPGSGGALGVKTGLFYDW